jgi:hypothetical protein
MGCARCASLPCSSATTSRTAPPSIAHPPPRAGTGALRRIAARGRCHENLRQQQGQRWWCPGLLPAIVRGRASRASCRLYACTQAAWAAAVNYTAGAKAAPASGLCRACGACLSGAAGSGPSAPHLRPSACTTPRSTLARGRGTARSWPLRVKPPPVPSVRFTGLGWPNKGPRLPAQQSCQTTLDGEGRTGLVSPGALKKHGNQ